MRAKTKAFIFELRRAATEHSHATERMVKLKATAEDPSADPQTRLAAQMSLDTIEWKRRARLQDRADDTPDKIEIAKRRGEARRNARRRVERITAGLPTRPRKSRPTGTWSSTERPDALTVRAGYRFCAVCARPIPDTRLRSSTCSPTCRRAAYRHSNLVNHVEGES